MKQRFDSLDVLAMVAHLQRTILGRRVVNIYDGENADTYILKLDGDPKAFLCLQSGIRFNDFDVFSADGTMPSPFCSKLRKHLRGLRIEQVKQIGTDRVVLFSFLGGNAGKHFIILELYAKGNLILTDADYSIVALLRSHVYQDKNNQAAEETVAVKVGSVYPVTYAADVTQSGAAATATAAAEGILSDDPEAWAMAALAVPSKKALTLKTLLLRNTSGVSQHGPALLEHCILFAKLSPHKPLKDWNMTAKQWQILQMALRQEAPAVLQRLTQSSSSDTAGFLIYDNMTTMKTSSNDNNDTKETCNTPILAKYPDKMLLEFQPHILLQHTERPYLEVANFGVAVHDFFGQLQTQKAVLRAQAATKTVQSKLEKARLDQQERLQALEEEQTILFRQAKAVEREAETVDQALTIINSALNSGMDWDQLEEIVQVEQENQNPIALLITALKLEDDYMTLRLPVDPYLDPDGETISVDIVLKETAHANASRLFGKYRNSKEKAQKTIESADKALQAAEETAQRQLAEAQKKTRQPAINLAKRKPFWFEKFHWFITSDNYLAVGGKDAHQNEILVKRYLRPGDAYLHADVHGASSVILRAKRRRTKSGKTVPIPLSEQALREAGNFTICHSSAWASRMVTSAWWVESHQVSKTAPSGEYLTVGSFMIRGKKNFLPPSQLEMGLAVLFRLGDEESMARHQNERRDFALLAMEEEASDDDDEEENVVHDKEGKNKESVGKRNVKPNRVVDEDDEQDEEESGNHETPETEIVTGSDKNKNGKKGLSARDRKLIKKYGSLEEAERVLASRPTDGDNGSVSMSASAATTTDGPEQPGNKRGKKAKLKRAKKKYGDQDEEDRELAMLLLQGSTKKDKRKEKTKQKQGEPTEAQQQVAAETSAVLKKDVSVLVEGLDEDVRNALGDSVEFETPDGGVSRDWQKIDFDIVEQLLALQPREAQLAAAKRLRSLSMGKNIDNLSLSLAGIIRTIRKHGYENLEKKVEEEEQTVANEAENEKGQNVASKESEIPVANEVDVDEDVGDDTAELTKLTGIPVAEDSLLYAMPVFAPYQTLTKYALRVKLTPGNMKRGKAAKAAIEMLLAASGQDGNGKRMKEMIKVINDNDFVQTLISDVKITSAGASKVTKQQKAKSKKNKKST
uniref:NFACT RNA-binding domain-containing protein n=1 Tax=Amphora coffeiformis TaxID=265554 RepID=A0A7S3KZD8_9STRA|mmetsp:Transcript_18187/g.36605  ORF Transcript_18187/g.36605 Transcript_18187/m.36605 type:complete len:1147 (-) Transcript_18187:26-3466(-)|eukprot:scaffold742_cov165-Amphora_coffeaeformis.AAC.16